MKIGLALLLIVFSSSVYAETERFLIKGEKTTGSRIARYIVSSNFPLYKTYADLSDSERAAVRSSYKALPAADNPPYPAEGMKVITEPLVDAHKRLNKRGDLYAIAKIDNTGKVLEVKVYKTPDKQMSQMVGAVLFDTVFNPGTCAGEPCEMEFLLDWQLEKHGAGMSGRIID